MIFCKVIKNLFKYKIFEIINFYEHYAEKIADSNFFDLDCYYNKNNFIN